MFFHPILALSIISLASQVQGHGFVAILAVEGKEYIGNPPAEGHDGRQTDSVIRQIQNVMPIKDLQDPDLACGPKAAKSDLVADANPGDNIVMTWVGGSSGETDWFHVVGPILTYMTSCGGTPCNKFDVTDAKWFKISDLVKNSNGEWYQAELQQGLPTTVQIPSTLAPGNYIIRQEIIALHHGVEEGGAEIFPSCSQLRVGGKQKGKPTEQELVNIPGVYTSNEPGIWPKGLSEPGFQYTVPGPAVAKLGRDSSNSSNASDGGSNSTSSATVASTAIKEAATPCKLDLAGHATAPLQATAKRSNSQHLSPAQLSSRHSPRARDYRSRLH